MKRPQIMHDYQQEKWDMICMLAREQQEPRIAVDFGYTFIQIRSTLDGFDLRKLQEEFDGDVCFLDGGIVV